MWQKLLDLVTTVVTLADELKQNREEIKEIRQELRDLTIVVHRLASDVAQTREHEASEREKLTLRLQNTLLKFE